MKETSKKTRVAIVISIIWPLLVTFVNEPWDYYSDSNDWFWIGFLPILIYWGYRFITEGWKGGRD